MLQENEMYSCIRLQLIHYKFQMSVISVQESYHDYAYFDYITSFKEFLDFFRKLSGVAQTTTDEEYKELFDRADADNNNKLNYEGNYI